MPDTGTHCLKRFANMSGSTCIARWVSVWTFHALTSHTVYLSLFRRNWHLTQAVSVLISIGLQDKMHTACDPQMLQAIITNNQLGLPKRPLSFSCYSSPVLKQGHTAEGLLLARLSILASSSNELLVDSPCVYTI